MKKYLTNDWDFIGNLPCHVAYLCVLPSFDALSLYPSIPHDLGLEFDSLIFVCFYH